MNAQELYYQGREAMDARDLQHAILLFQQSADIDPHFKTLELLGECFLETDQPSRAIVPLAAAVTMNRSVRSASLLAEAYFRIGQYQDAEQFADEALQRDSNNRKAKELKEKLQIARGAS